MLICDTHCDVLWRKAYHPEEECVVTMENMKKGGISLQVLALFSGSDRYAAVSHEVAMNELAEFQKLKASGWEQAFSPLEAEDGQTKVMLSIEGGEVMEGSVERLREFYAEGVRMIALTWNRDNEIAHSARYGSPLGIKPQGWAILREMEKLGVAADTSHLNERGFWDLIEKHGQPPMASHSCCRSLCVNWQWRNLSDEQIRAMIMRGGWIGVNFCPAFLCDDSRASVSSVCDQIDYICQLGGAKHVGLGSDYDGIEHTPEGLENPSKVPAIFTELRRRGYDEETVKDIAGRNFLAYYERLTPGK
ncbi:MAG: dipeptidase [Clostridiales bacterium]|nr:dipeptidase [Clostridiales bacterium]